MATIQTDPEEEKKKQSASTEAPEKQVATEIKADPKDAYAYNSRADKVSKRDYQWSALVPPEYFEKKRKEEEAQLEQKKRKERGRMKVAALADTFRLIGHGIGINKGAHETKWEKNEQIETGVKNLDKYTAEHAAAIDKLRDMEMRTREQDRNFGYRADRDAIGDMDRAEISDDANQKYIDQTRRGDEDRDYNRNRQSKLDAENAADKKEQRQIQRDRNAYYYGNTQTKNDGLVQASDRTTGNVYDLDINDRNDREAVAVMAQDFMRNVANKELVDKWKAEESPEWQSLRDMLDPAKKWSRDGISALMPYIFTPDVAEQYQVRRSMNENRATAPKQPSGGQGALDTLAEMRRTMAVGSKPQQQTPDGTVPYVPPTPAQRIQQKDVELRAKKEQQAPAQAPAEINERELRSIAATAQKKGFQEIKPEHRAPAMERILTNLYETGRRQSGEFIPENAEKLSKHILDYYYHADPAEYAMIEAAATRGGISIDEAAMIITQAIAAGKVTIQEIVTKRK